MIGLDLDLRVVKKVLNFLIIFFERFGNDDTVACGSYFSGGENEITVVHGCDYAAWRLSLLIMIYLFIV
jgi:hypothetical protein